MRPPKRCEQCGERSVMLELEEVRGMPPTKRMLAQQEAYNKTEDKPLRKWKRMDLTQTIQHINTDDNGKMIWKNGEPDWLDTDAIPPLRRWVCRECRTPRRQPGLRRLLD